MNTDFLQHLFMVILCGGEGTRVWPLSVNRKPKQFLNFYSQETVFQETYNRARTLVPAERIIIVTNEKYVDEIRTQVPEILSENIVAEPLKKNTALAMGVAAAYVLKKDPEGVIINLSSDHVIGDLDIYFPTLKTAANVAFQTKNLVAIGITPTYPHPGFGYIHIGEQLEVEDGLPVSKVVEFCEKPSVETAKKFLETGSYLWNANNYVWRADAILSAFDTLSPDIAKCIHQIENAIGTEQESEVLKAVYPQSPEEPIDTAISEKSPNLLVIPGRFKWNDIGSWEVVYELGQKDENGNVMVNNSQVANPAPTFMIDTQGALVHGGHQPIAVIGLKNIIVIDTGSGLLICDSKKSNDVKKVVQELQAKNLTQYL